ncbi:MAG: hypothetical protein RDU89_11040 [bacterium]|nr:hypothetical protein [bacterium]
MSGLAHQVGLFYTAVEDLLAHVALVFDEEVPRGEHWHRELLRGAALELPGLRPAVLGADLTNELDEYRRFRHRIRHVYLPPVPDWHKMAHLVDRLADVHGELDRQVRQFIAFLQHLAGST